MALMIGASKLALDYILPLIGGHREILDVGAGDSPLANLIVARGCKVLALDIALERMKTAWIRTGRQYAIVEGDFRKPMLPDASFDIVTAVYSIQHMMGGQAFAWAQIARILRPGGKLIHVGRYRTDAPVVEYCREDPLLADNELTVRTFALGSGLNVDKCSLFLYDGTGYAPAPAEKANVIVAEVSKPK